jgi:hypothetical protein
MEPDSFRGMVGWVLFGVGVGVTALLIATLFPNLIPAKAQGVNL